MIMMIDGVDVGNGVNESEDDTNDYDSDDGDGGVHGDMIMMMV